MNRKEKPINALKVYLAYRNEWGTNLDRRTVFLSRWGSVGMYACEPYSGLYGDNYVTF